MGRRRGLGRSPQGPPKHKGQMKEHEPATETRVAGGVGGKLGYHVGGKPWDRNREEQVGCSLNSAG